MSEALDYRTFICAGCGAEQHTSTPPVHYYIEDDPDDPYVSLCDRCMSLMREAGFNREPVDG